MYRNWYFSLNMVERHFVKSFGIHPSNLSLICIHSLTTTLNMNIEVIAFLMNGGVVMNFYVVTIMLTWLLPLSKCLRLKNSCFRSGECSFALNYDITSSMTISN